MGKNIQDQVDVEEEINLYHLFKLLWKRKLLIFLSTLLFTVSAVIYSLSLPNIYQSKTLLKPSDTNDGSVSSTLRGYGGLASFAGISLPSGDASTAQVAAKKIRSYMFFKEIFLPNINLEDLMAVTGWNYEQNELIFNENIYDYENEIWVRKAPKPFSSKPSSQEAHEVFLRDYFLIDEDVDSGFFTLSIKHHSPYIAKKWLEILVENINIISRNEEKLKTIKSINFLNQQIAKTNYSEVKEVLANILQKETEKLMLIEVNEDYIFQTIDPPIAPEKKSEPKRTIICIIAALLGLFVGILLALIRSYQNK